MKKLLFVIVLISILVSPVNQVPKSSQPDTLQEIWSRRSDLQTFFPNGKNGINQMEGWTLTQWAEEFGWKEYRILKRYNVEGEKDYIYEKYLPLERVLRDVSSNDYDLDDYNCVNFTKDLQKELNELDIASVKIIGRTPKGIEDGYRHEWIAIQFDSVTGEFVKVSDNYMVEELDEIID